MLQVPLAQRRRGYPLKIFFYMRREKLSNSEKLICTRINTIGYRLNRHGSWQHQLPKYWVNVYWPKMCVFAGLGVGGVESINVRVHVTLFPLHKKLDQSGFCQTRRDNCLNLRVGRKVTIFIGGVVLPVLFAFLRPVGLPWTAAFCIVKWHMRICGMCLSLWRFLLLDRR